MSTPTFGNLFGRAEVSASTSTPASAAGTAPGEVLGSRPNNDIEVIAGNKVDKSFLNALYASGKVTAAQRDSILSGTDPATLNLLPYDLYYLTVGRLGAKSVSVYGLIASWGAALQYAVGDLVTYQPAGSSEQGLYQVTAYPPVGTLPTNASYFKNIIPPGPVYLVDQDVTNPTLAAVAEAGAGILGQAVTSGTNLGAVIIPSGRRYVMRVSEIRGTTAGQGTPTDCHFAVELGTSETLQADGSVSLVITPKWSRVATGNNSAIAAVTAGAYTARVTVVLQ